MLVVVAVIAILVTIVISIAPRLDLQGKEHLTKSTIALLNTALSEFHDYGFTYADAAKYGECKFPLDCTKFPRPALELALQDAIGTTVTITYSSPEDPDNADTEVMCFLLSRVPQSKQMLEKIARKLLVSDGKITVTGEGDYPLWHINDAWGKALRYDYYNDGKAPGSTEMKDSIRTFPVITSAGPDKQLDTADDIKSR
jgi:type II secretory pathway pseudopilin PulG